MSSAKQLLETHPGRAKFLRPSRLWERSPGHAWPRPVIKGPGFRVQGVAYSWAVILEPTHAHIGQAAPVSHTMKVK